MKKRFPGEETCVHCRYYMTSRCLVNKEEGKHPGPYDSCYGWRMMTILDYENHEDAVRTAAEVRKEMREGGKV